MMAQKIKWDVDLEYEEEYFDTVKKLNLPESVQIPIFLESEEEISDWLTNTFGYCHSGC